jgi:heat shock protein HslJ
MSTKGMQSLESNAGNEMQLNGTYHINNLNSTDISSFKLNISFNDSTKQVSGFSGCNRFFGSYSLENNSLKFGNLGSTRMLCENEANQIETELLKALETADSFSIKNGTLQLLSKDNIIIEAYKEKAQDKSVSIEYTASSRGSYQQIIINETEISKSKKRGKNPIYKVYDSSKWRTLQQILDSIQLDNIPNLKAPSKDFQFDGAPIAKLKITSNGKTYETPPFDHGNPPKDLSELIKGVLTISEMIE